jgi:L-amino acid N-acyltransferase
MSNSFSVTIRPADLADVTAITNIYDEAILTTTASFDTETKTVEDRTEWFKAHDGRHPILVAVADDKVVGWA